MGELCGIDAASLGCLIETLYGAVQDGDAWCNLMGQLCHHLHADSALIRFYTQDWSAVALTATHGFDPSFSAAYARYFVHLDPIPGALEQIGAVPGTLAILDELIPHQTLKRTEFYNDYLRPQDKRHIMGGYLYQEGGARALFGVQRGHRRKPFAVADKSLLEVLTPHFRQVLRLRHALCGAKVGSDAFGFTLDHLAMAVFFLDKERRVLRTNACGEAELQSQRLLRLQRGHLHALQPSCDRVLQHLIGGAIASAHKAVPAAGGAVQLAGRVRKDVRSTALVTAWRRQVPLPDPLMPAVAATVLVRTCARPALKTADLISAYGFTRAEARLVASLVETCDLRRAAEAGGISQHTARSYLKSIFRKAGCRSQVELTTLILTSPLVGWRRNVATTSASSPC